MAKKSTGGKAANVSAVWDEKFHGSGTQHTIYAPQAFFDNWMGDESDLKRVVNDWLVENVDEVPYPVKKEKAPVKPAVKVPPSPPARPAAKPVPSKPAVFEIDDDDI